MLLYNIGNQCNGESFCSSIHPLEKAKWFSLFCVLSRPICFAVCTSGLERMRKRKHVRLYMRVELTGCSRRVLYWYDHWTRKSKALFIGSVTERAAPQSSQHTCDNETSTVSWDAKHPQRSPHSEKPADQTASLTIMPPPKKIKSGAQKRKEKKGRER